ncbi:MAG: hypothetical protein SGCHY_004115 [Lobulomycetales sp.]
MSESYSVELQRETESTVLPHLVCPKQLQRRLHKDFLQRPFGVLSQGFTALDASKPWIIYWSLHGLDLLDSPVPDNVRAGLIATLGQCQHPDGGFGGGFGQQAHLATTYAAVNAVCILQAYSCIDIPKLLAWFLRLKQPDGSFRMTDDGEVDVRGSYCVISAASLLNIATLELTAGMGDFIVSCQSPWDGGFSAIPGAEAHGGYTFCAFAALVLLDYTEYADLDAVLRWACHLQRDIEGGFAGRVNKLVDGCYSWWQGATCVLLEGFFGGTEMFDRGKFPFH